MVGKVWYLGLFVFLLLVFFFDIRNRRVPNLLLGIAILMQLFFFCFGFISEEWLHPLVFPEFRSALLGFLGLFVLFFPLWIKNVAGAGDVKFIAVLGLLLGWQPAAWVVLLSGFLTFPHALLQVLQVRRDGPHKKIERRGVPYAGYIALTAIIWLIWKLLE